MTNEEGRSSLLEADRAFARLSADTGPANAFRACLHDDGVVLTKGEENIIGPDAIYMAMSELPEGSELLWEPVDAAVAQSGEMGWTWGRYHSLRRGESGEVEEEQGKYLNVWYKNAQGEWKVLLDLGN